VGDGAAGGGIVVGTAVGLSAVGERTGIRTTHPIRNTLNVAAAKSLVT